MDDEYDDYESNEKRGAEFLAAPPTTKVGIAIATLGLVPINAMRLKPTGDTNGWYFYCGKQFSSAPDFFQPLHTRHLITRLHQVLDFLGLPPGYRFLLAGDYIDVWTDNSLLSA